MPLEMIAIKFRSLDVQCSTINMYCQIWLRCDGRWKYFIFFLSFYFSFHSCFAYIMRLMYNEIEIRFLHYLSVYMICRWWSMSSIFIICVLSIHFWDLLSQIHMKFTIHIFNSISFRSIIIWYGWIDWLDLVKWAEELKTNWCYYSNVIWAIDYYNLLHLLMTEWFHSTSTEWELNLKLLIC